MKGLDLTGISVEELGLSPKLAVEHSNSGGLSLKSVLERVAIPAGCRIVDFVVARAAPPSQWLNFRLPRSQA